MSDHINNTVPGMAHLHMRMRTRQDIQRAAYEMERLAARLDAILARDISDAVSRRIAGHEIDNTSRRLTNV